MKRSAFFTCVFLGAMVLASAWRPLAAQGIVSDEIWQLVDSLLQDADSPQLNIDLHDVMGRMSITADDHGNLYLMTSIIVYPQEVDAYATAIEEALAASNQFASGNTRSGAIAIAEYEIVVLDNNSVEILLYESLGTGTSQTAESRGKNK